MIRGKIYIVKSDGCSCGYLYFDPLSTKIATISVAILDVFSGKSIGKTAVQKLIDVSFKEGYEKIIAEIREDNVKSKKLFTSLGFKETNEFHLKYIENINQDVKMIKIRKKS
jgi:L-amino acid N-acyltransferase YncA